jgi:hypothetical protein
MFPPTPYSQTPSAYINNDREVKFVPAHTTKAYNGNRGAAALTLILGSSLSWVVIITQLGNKPQYPLNRTPQSWSEHFGRIKYVLPLVGFEPRTICPVT